MQIVVDKSNCILDVDPEWDEAAARTAGGEGAMSSRILGRPLDAFVAGDATKMFVRAALDAARLLGETRVLPYRCDSAYQKRRFEMVISPLDEGQVRIEHRLVQATPLAHCHLAPRTGGAVGWRCSQCLRVRLRGTSAWVESQLEPGALLAQDVCPSCARGIFNASVAA